MIYHERAKVLEVRDTGTVPSDIVSDVLSMLDVEESMLDSAERSRAKLRESVTERAPREGCAESAAPANLTLPELFHPGPSVPSANATDSPGCTCACVCSAGTSPAATHRWAATPSGHYEQTHHPAMISAEPGEVWRWCFVHELTG